MIVYTLNKLNDEGVRYPPKSITYLDTAGAVLSLNGVSVGANMVLTGNGRGKNLSNSSQYIVCLDFEEEAADIIKKVQED